MAANQQALLSASGAAYAAKSLAGLISAAGLSTGLILCLDAGDLTSYDGTSQTVTTQVGSSNFSLGATTGSEASDPSFTGSAGGLGSNANEYFSFDGGDYLREITAGWGDDEFHKDNAALTIAAIVYVPSASSAQAPIIGNDGGSGIGSVLRLNNSTRKLEWRAATTSNTAVLSIVSSATPSTNAWNFLGVALDEATGANGATLMINSTQEAFTSTYTSPSASAAAFAAEIMARGNANTLVPNTYRLMGIAAWSRRLSDANLSTLYSSIKSNRVSSLP